MDNVPKKSNIYAILGLIFSFLMPLLGFILSIIGLNKSKEYNSGKELSIAGIIISLILFFLFFIVIIIVGLSTVFLITNVNTEFHNEPLQPLPNVSEEKYSVFEEVNIDLNEFEVYREYTFPNQVQVKFSKDDVLNKITIQIDNFEPVQYEIYDDFIKFYYIGNYVLFEKVVYDNGVERPFYKTLYIMGNNNCKVIYELDEVDGMLIDDINIIDNKLYIKGSRALVQKSHISYNNQKINICDRGSYNLFGINDDTIVKATYVYEYKNGYIDGIINSSNVYTISSYLDSNSNVCE